MIKKIEFFTANLHFKESFTIAYETVSCAKVIIIKITGPNGFLGLGSAAPDEEVTGETIKKCLILLDKKLNKDFFSIPLNLWYLYHKKIQQEFAGFPCLQSAIEEALLNLFVSAKGFELGSLFGGYRTACPICFTLGIESIEQTLIQAQQAVDRGFKILKLKCGLDLETDLAKVVVLEKSLPKAVKLAVDVNQGYSFAQAEKFIVKIKNLGIIFLEQPIAAQSLEQLKVLSKKSPIPIIADEAVVDIKDAVKIITKDYANGVNIKLMKCGGPFNFLRIFHLAKIFNKIVMIGCMYESNISITTGAALALALPIDYVDLDSGRLDFDDDPSQGGAEVANGLITIGAKKLSLLSKKK